MYIPTIELLERAGERVIQQSQVAVRLKLRTP